MARVTLWPGLSPEPYFYNVDEAVGPSCPNRRDDVLLVQYFLKVAFDNGKAYDPPLVPPAGQPLTVTGMADPITFRWIKDFQEQAKKKGHKNALDGRVDKAKGTGIGTISHTQYTITFLNLTYKKVRPNDYANIAKAGDCPPDLASAVSLR
jgi:hypothetical protein